MRHSKVVRYVLVGGFAYLAEIGLLYLLHDVLHVDPIISVTISFWLGFGLAFVLQKYIAFQNHERARHVIIRQLVWYGLLVAWNYVFTVAIVAALEAHVSVLLCRTFAIFMITGWNFLMYKKIFKPAAVPTDV